MKSCDHVGLALDFHGWDSGLNMFSEKNRTRQRDSSCSPMSRLLEINIIFFGFFQQLFEVNSLVSAFASRKDDPFMDLLSSRFHEPG